MSAFVIGKTGVAITAGMTKCPEAGGASLPFFAVAPSDKLEDVGEREVEIIDDPDEVDVITDVFREHGSIVFFDTSTAAIGFIRMLNSLLMHAVENTNWDEREPQRETLQ